MPVVAQPGAAGAAGGQEVGSGREPEGRKRAAGALNRMSCIKHPMHQQLLHPLPRPFACVASGSCLGTSNMGEEGGKRGEASLGGGGWGNVVPHSKGSLARAALVSSCTSRSSPGQENHFRQCRATLSTSQPLSRSYCHKHCLQPLQNMQTQAGPSRLHTPDPVQSVTYACLRQSWHSHA